MGGIHYCVPWTRPPTTDGLKHYRLAARETYFTYPPTGGQLSLRVEDTCPTDPLTIEELYRKKVCPCLGCVFHRSVHDRRIVSHKPARVEVMWLTAPSLIWKLCLINLSVLNVRDGRIVLFGAVRVEDMCLKIPTMTGVLSLTSPCWSYMTWTSARHWSIVSANRPVLRIRPPW